MTLLQRFISTQICLCLSKQTQVGRWGIRRILQNVQRNGLYVAQGSLLMSRGLISKPTLRKGPQIPKRVHECGKKKSWLISTMTESESFIIGFIPVPEGNVGRFLHMARNLWKHPFCLLGPERFDRSALCVGLKLITRHIRVTGPLAIQSIWFRARWAHLLPQIYRKGKDYLSTYKACVSEGLESSSRTPQDSPVNC